MCHFYSAYLSEITGAAKGVFTHSQSSCHIAKVVLALTAAKSPQRLTRHLATPPAVSSLGGLRTPAPVRAAPPSWAGIRKPSQNRKYDHCSQGANASRLVPGECRTTISRFVLKKFSATMQPVARMRQDITMVQRRKERQKASILPST